MKKWTVRQEPPTKNFYSNYQNKCFKNNQTDIQFWISVFFILTKNVKIINIEN